jgi:twitching motility protein PilI
MSIASPYELLKQLDERCRRNSSGLPVASGVIEDWLGIGFAIDDMPLLASMDEVEEILPVPDTIRVPGVKGWVIGLANIRGNLMPVLDMNHYLHGTPTQLRKESRVLVVNNQGLLAALLVDEVFGLRRFKPEERRDETPAEAGSLGDYLSGMFIDQLRRWSVFSVDKLTRAEAFLRVVAG